jgi:hypothetical protein
MARTHPRHRSTPLGLQVPSTIVAATRAIVMLLFVSSLTGPWARGAEPGAAEDATIRIQYRDLIDDTIYGHSGRPAFEVLDRLALTTPDGLARRAVEAELEEKVSALRKEIAEADENADREVLKRKQEDLERAEQSLADDKVLDKRASDYKQLHARDLALASTFAKSRAASLVVDVEPVCEPAAFVLNDALAQKNAETFNQNLVELAAFYPVGRAEPAWADLIRTRRFVVYTDGGSYCRVFLPGASADKAWDNAYPAIRHVLRSLFKNDASQDKLEVDIYAYENDIASTTFTLHQRKLSRTIAAKDLGTPNGLTPLDLPGLSKFFADGLTLEGCGVKQGATLTLIGSKGSAQPTLEGHSIELSDLAVAYRASAYAGRGESYMSLDASGSNDFVNVNFGGRLYDTRLGWVAYRCDLRFKTLGDDVDAVSFENVEKMISTEMQDYVSQQQRQFADPAFRNISSEGTRFWFYPDDFKIVAAEDGRSCLVTRPRFTAAAERQESFDAKGNPLEAKTPPWTSLTLEHFNKNYDRFASLFPEVAELDHAARLLGTAEWLYQANHNGKIALDLDELLTVPLPANPTPRSREQLQIVYAVKKEGVPAQFRAYCLSTPRGRAEFERDEKSYLKPDSEWKLMSVTAGGLDYSARKAVKQASKAEGEYQVVLDKTIANAESFTAAGGKTYKPSGGGPPIKPPPKSPVTATAPEPGPGGGRFSAFVRQYITPTGDAMVSISAREGKWTRVQKISTEAGFGDSAVHSVWLSEHGAPQRFATDTSKGVVTYMLPDRNGILIATKARRARPPSAEEAEFLAAALAEKKRTPADVWNLVPVDADVHAIDRAPDGEALIYFRENGEEVVRAYKGNSPVVVLKGEKALQRLREASRAKAHAYSVPGKVELLYASNEGDKVVLQIGRRDPISVETAEWGKWLVAAPDTGPPDVLKPLLDDLAKSGAELIVIRDALQARPRRAQKLGLAEFMDGLYRARNDRQQKIIERLKLTETELQAEIDELTKLQGQSNLSTAQKEGVDGLLAELEILKKMPESEKTAKVAELEVERQRDLATAMVFKADRDAVALTSALKERLPKLHVSFDDPSSIVPQRVLSEPMVTQASDVGLAIPPGEAGVDDKGILKTVAGSFEQSKIPLIRSPEDLKAVGNVIIITAHNDKQLFDYIQSLGEHTLNGKSALDGKLLMLTTCFEEGNPNMVSELLRRYNCAGVHVQAERVNKDAVKRALIEFGNALGNLKPGASPRHLRDMYEDAIKSLLQREDPSLEFLKPELEKLLRARIQWCGIFPSGPERPIARAA